MPGIINLIKEPGAKIITEQPQLQNKYLQLEEQGAARADFIME